jgi:hypothetical protein
LGKIVDRKGDIIILENDKYEDVIIEISFSRDKQVYEFFIDNKLINTITDIYGSNSNSFTRVIDNSKFIINNGIIVFKSLQRRSKFISILINLFYFNYDGSTGIIFGLYYLHSCLNLI